MNLFQLILIYLVGWWMVLFIILPIGVKIPEKAGKGHAPSAPMHFNLKRKLIQTTLFTFLLPLIAYGIEDARSASGIYHAGRNDCVEPADVVPDSSVNAIDSDATIGGAANGNAGIVPTYLNGDASQFTRNKQVQRLDNSIVNVGVAETDTRTGEVRINGTPVGSHATSTKPAHCK